MPAGLEIRTAGLRILGFKASSCLRFCTEGTALFTLNAFILAYFRTSENKKEEFSDENHPKNRRQDHFIDNLLIFLRILLILFTPPVVINTEVSIEINIDINAEFKIVAPRKLQSKETFISLFTRSSLQSFFFRPTAGQRLIQAVSVLTLLIFLGAYLGGRTSYRWQWYRLPSFLIADESNYGNGLISGLKATFIVLIGGGILGFFIGLLAALGKLSSVRSARFLASCYIQISRNTPLLVQISLFYFVIDPLLGLSTGLIEFLRVFSPDRSYSELSGYLSGILAIALFEGAYTAEIIRSGILSVPSGQKEAALSLGLSRRKTFHLIIFPSAVRNILPMLVSQSVNLIKDTSLVYVISVYDLTYMASTVASRLYMPFEVWFTAAFIYLLLCTPLSLIVQQYEKRRGFHA